MTRACMRRSQRGATLIEVLVALVILTLGLLGTAALQSSAQNAELESYQRSQALLLAQDMINRINSNRRAARCYETYDEGGNNYVGQGQAPTACSGWGTSATRARADDDMDEWTDMLVGALEQLGGNSVGAMSGARGCVLFDETEEVFRVTVAWQGQMSTQAPADNDCAEGEYGNENLRRVVELAFRMGDLD